MSKKVLVALITSIGLIIVALIQGSFSYVSSNTIKNDQYVKELASKFDTVNENMSFDQAIETICEDYQKFKNDNTIKNDIVSNDYYEESENIIPLIKKSKNDNMEYFELKNNNEEFKDPKLSARLFLDVHYSSAKYGKAGICSIEFYDFYKSDQIDEKNNTILLTSKTTQSIYNFINLLQELLKREKYKIDNVVIKKYYIFSYNNYYETKNDSKIYMTSTIISYNQDKLVEETESKMKEIYDFREYDFSIPTNLSGGFKYKEDGGESSAIINKPIQRGTKIDDTDIFIENFISEELINDIMLKKVVDDYDYIGTNDKNPY